MTYAVGFNGYVTVRAEDPVTALALAKDLMQGHMADALDWDKPTPYESCDMPGCERPAQRVGTGAVDETGYREEIAVCPKHSK